jgi:hypothetical protein
VDPFTGAPLFFKSTTAGYVVYSVGRDRRDDGGEAAGMPLGSAFPRRHPPGDIGVRIDIRR